MAEKQEGKRKLVDITLEEAVRVLELGEGLHKDTNYQLRTRTNTFDETFAQLFYVFGEEEHITANFSDLEDAVILVDGNSFYRTCYKIIKYLEERGFDLSSADREQRHAKTSFG